MGSFSVRTDALTGPVGVRGVCSQSARPEADAYCAHPRNTWRSHGCKAGLVVGGSAAWGPQFTGTPVNGKQTGNYPECDTGVRGWKPWERDQEDRLQSCVVGPIAVPKGEEDGTDASS